MNFISGGKTRAGGGGAVIRRGLMCVYVDVWVFGALEGESQSATSMF